MMKEEINIESFRDHVILVEGKKDVVALNELGLKRVHALHKINSSLRERVEEIIASLEKGDKVCILTDRDSAGKKMHATVKAILQESGVNVDVSLRRAMAREGLSHTEGFSKFIERRINRQI
jgi:5S rRNA maturation endonuclease (ribonuclease M5)